MTHAEKVQAIKSLLANTEDQEVMVSINGVDFDYIGYDADSDTAFLYSQDHDIECEVDETLRDSVLEAILEYIG